MARGKQEQHQSASNMPLIGLVGWAIAFLLFMAFLNVVKNGNLFSETNLLTATLVFYAGACTLYLGFGLTSSTACVRYASLAIWLGLLANTAAVILRWDHAGHPPFSNIYEMLLSSVWMLAVLTLVAESRFGIRVIGAVTMPLAIVGLVLMEFLRTEVHPLVPLLQSTWLHVHVTMAILAYAACAVSFALAMMFLIKDNMRTESFLAVSSGCSFAVYLIVAVTRLSRWGMAGLLNWSSMQSTGSTPAPAEPGLLLTLTLCATLIPLVCYALWRWKPGRNFMKLAQNAMIAGIALQAITIVLFVLRSGAGHLPALDTEGIFPATLGTSPFILSGLVGALFISLLFLMLLWRRPDLDRLLPSADVLDRITYRTICLAFPLLTLMIATGAYWANQTWGSYWSWDPKETWAAITWMVYALYLHMRITGGWRGRRAAYFAIVGFAVVIFTFFGVTYLLPGLHAFA